MSDPVVVIGAGLSGAACAWSLSRRNVPVVVVEQFTAGHRLGSSHGSARIVRRGYGDALYVSLTGRAFELWREVEIASGATLLRMLGGLDFGVRRDVSKVAALLAEAGVPHEVLPAAEAATRWPGMEFEGDVVFHDQAGTLDADGAVAALLAEAARMGADVRYETPATSVGEQRVGLADGTTLAARCVIAAAGGWIEPMLSGVLRLPALRVTQQQIFHFPRLDPSAPPWPSVIHEPVGSPVYHLAGGRDGGPGDDRKIGQHDGGKDTTAAGRDGLVNPEARAWMIDYVRRWLPGLEPTPCNEATCLYTQTPSEDFLIDRVGELVVCSPCSGHGAKFAPLVGELVADLVTGSGTVPERFRLAAHLSGRVGSVSL
ncbi:MAG TPA: FAD-dependent oxidoreductase [Jatrophihabitans sp.]|jgi:sarcosine oxidase|nr:FAD-dependent oxidoreductase [Jatrophihabitans sp.]